jgi:chemosensory pili system protein ChpA (sensor histidine kinase/response regulator)
MSEQPIGRELVDVFTAETLADMQTLSNALFPADQSRPSPESLRGHYILAHKLSGASMNYGYGGLAHCGGVMEQLLEYATEIAPSQWPDAVVFLRELVENCLIRVELIAKEGTDEEQLPSDWTNRLAALIPSRFVGEATGSSAAEVSVAAEYCVPAIDSEVLEFFIPEIEEYVGTVGGLVTGLRAASGDSDHINALFRTVHTIKGSAYTVGYEVIGDLAAPLEDCLGGIRDGTLSVPLEVLDATELTMGLIRSLLRRNHGDLANLQREVPAAISALRRLQSCGKVGETSSAASGESMGTVEAARPVGETQAFPLTAEYVIPDVDAGDFAYFLPEAISYLQDIENLLLTLEKNPADEETIRQLFGTVHTLKGSAYTINFQVIGDLAHIVEDYLDAVGRKRLNITGFFTDVMLKAVDVVRLLLHRDSNQLPRLKERVTEVRAALATLGRPAVSAVAELSPETHAPGDLPESVTAGFLDSRPEDRPGSSSEGAIGAVDDQQIRVRRDRLEQLLNFVGELIIARGRLERRLDVLSALTGQVQACKNRLLNSIQAFEQKHTFTMPSAVPQSLSGTANAFPGITEFGELEFDKYDDFNILARRIGEGAADISESIAQLNTSLLIAREELNGLQELTTGIRDQTVRARMVSIGGLFSRFRRSVRESARATGKDVNLVMTGERTEIDTGVVDRLIDPLIHLMRNAVFHGIESAQVRIANGKVPTGTIRLNAAHRGNTVLIEVEDDGRGLDIEAIRAKAIERGLVSEDRAAQLTEAEIVRFIFVSGLSTADASTDQAGRGVGMDVVERVIRSMNGRIEIDTVKGQGTKFSLSLPLSLLITMGLIVGVGGMRVAIPLANIREITLPIAHPIKKIGSLAIMEINDELIELHALSDLLGYMAPAIENSTPVVIVHTDAWPKGLAVTKLLGQQEIVIKPFASPKLMDKGVFSGATFDLDGKVIPVLDVNRLFARNGDSARVISLQPSSEVQETEGVGVEGGPAPEQLKMFSVLLIDDSLSIRKFVGRMLEAAGYQVATAANGEEGVRMASTQSYHLIITDLEMPKLNGYEVIQALRARPQTQAVPILVMTTRAGEKHRKLALEVGATGYIAKPVEERTLLNEVERVTGGAAKALR